MKKELRFYAIDVENNDSDVSPTTLNDELFMQMAEEQGFVFTLQGFVQAFNDEYITTSNFVIRAIEVGEVSDIPSPQGDFVNDGSHYQFMDYVFQSTTDDEGFSSLDVYDFEDNHMGELGGVTLPDEDDREAILNFESLLTTWLKGSNLI